MIRRVIASELEYIEDERLELVSLTGVEVDRDLHKAVIYFTTFDRDGDPEIDEAFEEYRGRLRHAVSRGTQLRRAPNWNSARTRRCDLRLASRRSCARRPSAHRCPISTPALPARLGMGEGGSAGPTVSS